jgi:hypothetical protein
VLYCCGIVTCEQYDPVGGAIRPADLLLGRGRSRLWRICHQEVAARQSGLVGPRLQCFGQHRFQVGLAAGPGRKPDRCKRRSHAAAEARRDAALAPHHVEMVRHHFL